MLENCEIEFTRHYMYCLFLVVFSAIFFKVTFQHQPGAQYEHCFITSKRQHVLFIQTGLVHAEVSEKSCSG